MVSKKKKVSRLGRSGSGGSSGSSGGLSLMAVDPGSTTGVVWVCLSHQRLKRDGVWKALGWAVDRWARLGPDGGPFDCRELEAGSYADRALVMRGRDPFGEYAMAHDLVVWARKYATQAGRVSGGKVGGLHHLIVEDFVLRRSASSGRRDLLAPVRIQSALEYALWINWSSQSLVIVSPPSNKKVASNDRLKRHGLWAQTSGLPHGRDALRHLISYLLGQS